MTSLSKSMKDALQIMLAIEEKGGVEARNGVWLSTRNASEGSLGATVAERSADALASRGLVEVFSILNTAVLTDEGREVARSLATDGGS